MTQRFLNAIRICARLVAVGETITLTARPPARQFETHWPWEPAREDGAERD